MAAIGTINGEAEATRTPWDRAVRLWLYAIAGLVLAMITVGGATRLTDSGLSITEWQPILGAIPPLTDEHWQEAFAKYKEIPEYHLVNKGMSLEAFKAIYWWEWGHRFLGRIIGLAFALPLAVFWYMGGLRPGYPLKLAGVLALGGLQGVIGWYMVKSGLVDRVDVSQYRLALHLTVAFVILALVVWLAFELAQPESERARGGLQTLPLLIVAAIFLQVVIGAFVASLKGGLVYNTWPSMNGALIPDDLLAIEPWYHNPFENPVMAQFNHRLVAYAVVVLAAVEAWRRFAAPAGREVRISAALLLAGVIGQAALGIWTLLEAVPLGLGIAHQRCAAILLVLAVRHLHVVSRRA
ncbi:COX15/CtaA family protein [Hyphomicrobium sp.]|uniref:COX15/CtaA family protein n=1 Tax=Hyphomicrobium sp. TaxID=82 RepID=UPI0025B98413|nr:COX15/CtaA family protein [Hyphomicrobium sp.]MCC7254156.1 COX15/CtaA family protein [Hyphomicrobium sp.]